MRALVRRLANIDDEGKSLSHTFLPVDPFLLANHLVAALVETGECNAPV